MRAFIAIEVGGEARRWVEEALGDLRERYPRVRWLPPENIHLTLRFLGDVPAEAPERIEEALRGAARETSPFVLALGAPGTFGGRESPRVLWLGVEGAPAALCGLHSRLEEGLEAAGFGRDGRAFSPHVTVARNRRRERGLGRAFEEALAGAGACPSWWVRDIELLESTLTPRGAVYRPLARVEIHDS